DPRRLLRRSEEWIFGPMEGYERQGDVDNVVFPCGWIQQGDELRLYYGGADTCIALATASLRELLDYLRHCPEK
ncbi:MAG TPA: glycosidase, partial [bacterium]|nr:glycosidase [bacterium]